VREAREKLTASAPSHYGFDLDCSVFSRKDAALQARRWRGLGALAATVAPTWIAVDTVLLWLALDLGALLLASHFAGNGASCGRLDAQRPPLAAKFIFTEALQGVAWPVMVWFIGQSGDSDARSFVLVLFLLVAAMNATISASIPFTLTCALAPMTLAILGFLCSASLSNGTLP